MSKCRPNAPHSIEPAGIRPKREWPRREFLCAAIAGFGASAFPARAEVARRVGARIEPKAKGERR